MKSRKASKFLLIIIGLILGCIIVEIFLRIGAFIYNFIHKPPVMDNKIDISIFCIGESTTWGIGAKYPEEQGYPIFLEKMLQVKYPKKNIRCFYDQTIGQNTSEILWKLPKYIEKYRPQVIILMVGVNNYGSY